MSTTDILLSINIILIVSIMAILVYFKWWSQATLPVMIRRQAISGKTHNTNLFKKVVKSVNDDAIQMFKNNRIEFMEDFPNTAKLINKNPNAMKMFGEVLASQSIFVPFIMKLLGMENSKVGELAQMSDIPDQILFKGIDYLTAKRKPHAIDQKIVTDVGKQEHQANLELNKNKGRFKDFV